GFDLLELPLAEPYSADGALIGRIVRDHSLALTASLRLTAENDVSSEDPATVQRGVDLLRRAADVVAEAGGEHLWRSSTRRCRSTCVRRPREGARTRRPR